MKLISIVTPCYNEAENVEDLYNKVKEIFSKLPQYNYEHIFIDNASKDKTVEILKGLASKDKNVKIIVNSRNFGHIRSPFYGMLQGRGDAVIWTVADFQDPPELIPQFLKKWEEGFKVVVGVKEKSKESPLMFALRRLYYSIITRLSDIEQIPNFTGFGLYDKKIIEILRGIEDPYPYFRGLIAEVGFERTTIEFEQPKRKKGKTKNNFYTLFDMAMLGITNHSRIPLRLATMIGFAASLICILISVGYFAYKVIFWNSFSVGMAPLVIGFFFFASVQLFFIGLLGEYIGAILTQVQKRPIVIEKERINF